MRKVVVRFNFSCTLIGNRPQTLTGHIVNRYSQWHDDTPKEIFFKNEQH